MADLVDRSTAVVKRYGGTLSQFTGDGIMAVFGAPITLEDHAFRACMAALDIQKEVGTTLQAANRPELRPGHCGRNRLQHGELHDHRRAGRHGPADGVGRAAGRSDAQRVHRATRREHRRAWRPGVGPHKGHRRTGARAPVAVGRSAHKAESPRRDPSSVGRAWELNTVTANPRRGRYRRRRVVSSISSGSTGHREEPTGPRSHRDRRSPRPGGVSRTYCESHATDVPFHVS